MVCLPIIITTRKEFSNDMYGQCCHSGARPGRLVSRWGKDWRQLKCRLTEGCCELRGWREEQNKKVLQMARVSREMMTIIRKRQLGFPSNILRGNGLEKDCLICMVKGRRARGRQRTKFNGVIEEVVGYYTTDGMLQLAEDRGAWRSIVTDINVDTALRYSQGFRCSLITRILYRKKLRRWM